MGRGTSRSRSPRQQSSADHFGCLAAARRQLVACKTFRLERGPDASAEETHLIDKIICSIETATGSIPSQGKQEEMRRVSQDLLAEAAFLKGCGQYLKADLAEAVKNIKQSLDLEPSSGGRWYFFAGVLLKLSSGVSSEMSMKLKDLAESALLQAVDKSPELQSAYLDLETLLWQRSDLTSCRLLAQRAIDNGACWVNAWQRPPHFCRDLSAKPWWDKNTFEWSRQLEESYPLIRQELTAALLQDGQSWLEVGSQHAIEDALLLEAGSWKEIVISGVGDRNSDINQQLCPKTTELLKSIPAAWHMSHLCLGECIFSAIDPSTHLRPHCGFSNTRLTCHLGIAIPERCRLRVAEETRYWEEGKCLFFDDSFEHEVWNVGKGRRIVLLIRFWHPEISSCRWDDVYEDILAAKRAHEVASLVPPIFLPQNAGYCEE